jgi:hypothetical protein
MPTNMEASLIAWLQDGLHLLGRAVIDGQRMQRLQ